MLEAEWDLSAYADEYREELLRIIAEKTPNEIIDEPEKEPGSAVQDLMAALKASVEVARQRPKPKPSSEVGLKHDSAATESYVRVTDSPKSQNGLVTINKMIAEQPVAGLTMVRRS